MNLRNELFPHIKKRKEYLKLREAQVCLLKSQIEILEKAFDEDFRDLGSEEAFHMKEAIKEALISFEETF